MKLRRRISSVFLAFAMALSLIPSVAVSALAAPETESTGVTDVTGGEPFTIENASVDFRLGTTQLYKLLMLEAPETSAKTEINSVYLLLNQEHSVLGTEAQLYPIGAANRDTDWYNCSGNYNWNHTLEPSNIRGLRINYTHNGQGGTAEISPQDLRLHIELGPAGVTADYTIMSSNDEKSIVAFYDNGERGQQTDYYLYDAYIVNTSSCLNTINAWPTTPTYTAYTFVNWDTNKGGGAPFLESTIVNGDTEVFSQKITTDGTSAGTEIHVMNRNNELIDRFVELYNAKTGRTITSNDVILNDQFKITVYGEGDTHTNPDYSAGVGSSDYNHWINNSEYYMVVNRDADVPVAFDENWNIQVNHSEITKIVVSAQVKLSDETVIGEVTINKGTAPGDFAVSFINNTIIELHILQEGEVEGEPDVPPEPGLGEAKLTVEKTVAIPDGDATASVGDTLEYTITVTNSSDAAAEDVKVWDSLWTDPNGAVLVNGTESYVSVAGGFCIVNVPTNGETTIYYTYTVPEEKAGQELTNNVWIVEKDEDNPDATVTVTVEDEQPEVPDAPDEGDIPGILGADSAILVDCVSDETHANKDKVYNLWADGNDEKNRYDVSGVTNSSDGEFTCTVTILPGVYVDQYNKDTGLNHWLVDEDAKAKITLTWDEDNETWTAPEKAGDYWATFQVTCKPDAPADDDIPTILGSEEAVLVKCVSNAGHDLTQKYYNLVANDTENIRYEVGDVVVNGDGTITCTVTILPDVYVARYNGEEDLGAIQHKLVTEAAQTVTLSWTQADGWTAPDRAADTPWAVFNVECAPDAPTPDQLAGLFKVQIDCITSDKWGDQYKHKNEDYAPIEGSYTLGNVTANADGTWYLEVTVAAEKYVAQYSVDRNETHTLADAYSSKTVTLVYQDDGTWSKLGDNIAFAFDVKCNPEYDLVYHGCGGTTENGKETVSSTFPYFGEATIKNNRFLRDGYVFEGWALTDDGDVVYTGGEDVTFNDVNFPGLSENKGADLYAVWALDKQGEIDPDTGEETGDGIADYRQVFVRYKSADATLGSVAPAYQVVNLDLDKNGDPIVVDISLDSVATANEGAEFIYWMQGLENTVSYEASLKDAGLTLKNYTPGYTYEFTAYFMDSDIGKPEPVQTYKIDVDVTNGTGTFFGTEVTTHILAMEGEDITIAFAPDAGYALDTVTVDGEPAVLTADGTYTFTKVAANHSITVVYATDAWNDKDDTTTGGDGIPDK